MCRRFSCSGVRPDGMGGRVGGCWRRVGGAWPGPPNICSSSSARRGMEVLELSNGPAARMENKSFLDSEGKKTMAHVVLYNLHSKLLGCRPLNRIVDDSNSDSNEFG